MMGARHEYSLPALAVLAVAAGLAFWFLADGNDGNPASGRNSAAAPLDLPLSAQAAVSSATAAELPSLVASKVSPAQQIKVDWYGGFASSNVYKEVTTLRTSRKPGSHGAGLLLALPCVGLHVMNNPRSDPMVRVVGNENHQMRLQAKDRLMAYCGQIPGEALAEFTEPLPDDVFGAQYRAAIKTLNTAMVKSKQENRAALDELARQGLLSQGKIYILMNLKLNGKALAFPSEEADAAFDIAELRATSNPEMASKDIRLQYRCWVESRCDESYGAVSSRFSEAQRQKILALAAEIEPALRKGDVSALIGPP